VTPDFSFANSPAIDLLVVPGGLGARPLLDDSETIDWIRKASAQAKKVTSVCTGSLLLAKGGLLKGRRATTHWGALDLLKSLEPQVQVERERFVDDGIITSGGISAGIDMAFYIVETLFGKEVADETAHYMEYRRADFNP
jgi:transcriptional regulator GlxA family with amidase domain